MISMKYWHFSLFAHLLLAQLFFPASVRAICTLKVSDDGRFLVFADGTPFYYQGDVAWELATRLSREEVVEYFNDRASKKFSVVQLAAISGFSGAGTNFYNHRPCNRTAAELLVTPGNDPGSAEAYDYWDHLDFIVDQAAARSMFVAIEAAWHTHCSPDNATKTVHQRNVESFGKFLGGRYIDRTNVIWMIGGGAKGSELTQPAWKSFWKSLARGIVFGETGRTNHQSVLIGFHAGVGQRIPSELGSEDWIDFYSVGSGAGQARDADHAWRLIAEQYLQAPIKPVLDCQPIEEDISRAWGRSEDSDVRKASYWGHFSGSFGHVYGHVSVSQSYKQGLSGVDGVLLDWNEGLKASGSDQMRWLQQLSRSRPMLRRVPAPDLIFRPLQGGNRIVAAHGTDYLFVYSPHGLPFELRMGKISGKTLKGYWFDPRNGSANAIGEFENTGTLNFTPPTTGRGNDWVLVLDDIQSAYARPGN